MLILQTDAIILRDELDYWCAQPFDYIGAPWRSNLKIHLNTGRFSGGNEQQINLHVGNGGLSLRRVNKCLSALKDFGDIVELFIANSFNEDAFFSLSGVMF